MSSDALKNHWENDRRLFSPLLAVLMLDDEEEGGQ